MTNLEAIKAIVGPNFPMDDTAYTVAFLEAGLDPEAEFVPGQAFDMAVIALIGSFTIYVKRISEGGYTIEYDTDKLWRLRSYLLWKWGIQDLGSPYLRDRTNKW